MKKYALSLCALLVPCVVLAGGIEIKVNRKNLEAQRLKAPKFGENPTGSETVAYQVSVQNKEFKAMPPLKARYIIFVERQQIGQKVGTETVEQIKGEADVPEMGAMKGESFVTNGVKLLEEQLSGKYIAYTDGGRIKAKDRLVGIWVRFFDGETQVGEYVNPVNLKTRHTWE